MCGWEIRSTCCIMLALPVGKILSSYFLCLLVIHFEEDIPCGLSLVATSDMRIKKDAFPRSSSAFASSFYKLKFSLRGQLVTNWPSVLSLFLFHCFVVVLEDNFTTK